MFVKLKNSNTGHRTWTHKILKCWWEFDHWTWGNSNQELQVVSYPARTVKPSLSIRSRNRRNSNMIMCPTRHKPKRTSSTLLGSRCLLYAWKGLIVAFLLMAKLGREKHLPCWGTLIALFVVYNLEYSRISSTMWLAQLGWLSGSYGAVTWKSITSKSWTSSTLRSRPRWTSAKTPRKVSTWRTS
jgi:hypothetical protein